MGTRKHSSVKTPSSKALRRAASMAKEGSSAPIQASPSAELQSAKSSGAASSTVSSGRWLSFFFDGTGNNQDADLHTEEHSNVARLYRGHLDNDSERGIFRIYIPGIGTYFKAIDDDGGSLDGLAFGAMGDARLDWAMAELERTIAGSQDMVHVALFGFSRGAALARAFAQRLTARCTFKDGAWYLTASKRPIRLYFMGLFDTVASVGLPTSVNNSSLSGFVDLRLALLQRSTGGASLFHLAPGSAPGADPAPGFIDGHASWGGNLRIPEMAERCVHMVAAHEIRNSFPVESLRDGNTYPAGCEEYVFPGSHSDVGGGYRPEEGARGMESGGLLSMIPLRRMHQKALESGVPLRPLSDLKAEALKKDFALDASGAAAFKTLASRYNHYLKAVTNGGVPLGTALLSHMKLYYRWRFHKIAKDLQARKAGKKTADEVRLRASETVWSEERRALDEEKKRLWDELTRLRIQARPQHMHREGFMPMTAEQLKYHRLATAKEDEYLKIVARIDTLPGSVDKLLERTKIYDEQLLMDALTLKQISNKGKTQLRPHYQAILDAFVAEFESKNGLKDTQLIAFFDDYVHDSLAGFGQDSTLPSDPRIVYIGGDEELKYAMNSSRPSWWATNIA